MKKLIPLLILVGGVASGFAQGTVAFLNNVTFSTPDPSGGARLVYSDAIGSTKMTGTSYVAELYAGADASSLTPYTISIAKFRASTTSQPGTWNFLAGSVTLNGFDIGSAPTLQVKVWDKTLFATYELASAGGGTTGSSTPFSYVVPAAGSPAFAYYMEGMRSFALVPEPSAIALGIMGVAGLLLVRRRK